MSAGVKTPNLTTVSVADSVIVNRDGSTAIQSITNLAQQLNADLNIAPDRAAADLAVIQTQAIKGEVEAARDAAFVNAAVYATTAAGLATTSVGNQFQVVVGDEIIRYRHDAGPIAVEVARYPTNSSVS